MSSRYTGTRTLGNPPIAAWHRAAVFLVAACIQHLPLAPIAALSSAGVAVQGAVTAAPTAGLPAETVSVPITLTLDPGVHASTLGMTLSVDALNGAPTLRRPVSFLPGAALPAPDVLKVQSNDTVRIEWNTPWNPPLTGTVLLGLLEVRLAATAPGQAYDVEVGNLGATTDGVIVLPLAGVTGRIARCSVRFSGHVTDALTSGAIADAVACLQGGSTCVHTDGSGFYSGLCDSGQSSAGTTVCANALGYRQSCQGPWTASGSNITVDFQLLPAGAATPTPTPSPPIAACVGDCDGDGRVDITELLRGVNIGLGVLPPAACPAFDYSADCGPSPPESVACLIRAVNNALTACPPTTDAGDTLVQRLSK